MLRDIVPMGGSLKKTDDWFDSFFNDDFFRVPVVKNDMKVDIRETEKDYVFEVEIPGIKKEQVSIDYKNDYLTVGITREDEIKEEKKNYIRRERRSGNLCRTFRIGNVNRDDIKARIENGLLSIHVPKDEKKESSYRIDVE